MNVFEISTLLGNFGEFLGAIVVVITLIYVALQLRANTEAVRSASVSDINNQINDLNMLIMNDESMIQLFARFTELPMSELTARDQLRLGYFMTTWLRILETLYYQQAKGTVSAELWQVYRGILGHAMLIEFARHWWKNNYNGYQRDFTAEVNAIVSEAEERGVAFSGWWEGSVLAEIDSPP